MDTNKSIINLNGDGFTKPATVFIEKISDAIGGLAKPSQIRRVARAEAAAEIIKAKAKIKVSELEQRALIRLLKEEARSQSNIESIAKKAIPHLNSTAQPQNMNDDWISNFFDECRSVSEEEMQNLWAKILAEEANSPGAFSKRTINFLKLMDKNDADRFTSLCAFGLIGQSPIPFIMDIDAPIYSLNGIAFKDLKHLDEIGLLSFAPVNGYKLRTLPKQVELDYQGELVSIQFQQDKNNELEIGKVLLSQVGKELALICKPSPVPGFIDYLVDLWIKRQLVVFSSLEKTTA